jgi:hypothetical protein
MTHFQQVIDELAGPTPELRQASPAAWAGFGALHKAAVADGALPAEVKELESRGRGADGVDHGSRRR